MLGILLVDKPTGLSSHDVVHGLRRRFNTKRIGHAGTLDPLATGLLVIAVGPATRFLQYLPLEPKVYRARVTFGQETNTFDAEGEVVSAKEVPSDLQEAVEGLLPSFKGLIQQLPPMFSAVKKAGKPLYHYARKGETIEREPRTVHIGRLEIETWSGTEATMLIECSGGTYIRTLAHDIGQALGCGAYLSGLVRLAVGKFALENASALDDVGPSSLVSLASALEPMQMVKLNEDQVRDIREGRQVQPAEPPQDRIAALLDMNGRVIGVARSEGGMLQPECVIPREASFDSI